jgi:hypothetical protein
MNKNATIAKLNRKRIREIIVCSSSGRTHGIAAHLRLLIGSLRLLP